MHISRISTRFPCLHKTVLQLQLYGVCRLFMIGGPFMWAIHGLSMALPLKSHTPPIQFQNVGEAHIAIELESLSPSLQEGSPQNKPHFGGVFGITWSTYLQTPCTRDSTQNHSYSVQT